MVDPHTRTLVRRIVEQDLLADGVLDVAGHGVVEEPEPPAPPDYELLERIGRGGCGLVYRARDRRLDRLVALKFMAEAGPADLERFRREARAAARLNSPAIVQVYELGEVEGRPYIAMQLVDGESLATAEMDHRTLVRTVRDVALALRCAHAEGIVHRDIKPENILLDKAGHVYLTDFGLARSLDGGLGATLSLRGQILGTPGLMSPEQARGDIASVDARSDVYGLGATMYVKLTGTHPFDGTNVVDVLHAVMHDAPPLPRSRRSDIPRSLEAVVLRCMQKRRSDRYQTVDELVADLDRLLGGGQLGAGTWFRRLVSQQQPGVPPERRLEDEGPDPLVMQGLEIMRRLAAWDADLYRVSGSLTRSFERLESIRRDLEAILARRPDTAWARFYRGVTHFRAGRLDEALEDMEPSIDRVRDAAGASFELGRLYLAIYLRDQRRARKHLSRVGVEHDLSSVRGTLDQAAIALGEAERLDGELPGWHAEYARAVERLAESDFLGCIGACDHILEREPDVEEIWKLRGDAERLAGRDPFESYDRALRVRRTYYEALHARAEAAIDRGDLDAAREALRRARKIHPAFACAAALSARVELEAARRDDDAKALELAAEAAEHAITLDPTSYEATVTLAEIRLETGRRRSDDGVLERSLTHLDAAATLDGCQNRVQLLRARVLLARAGLAAAAEANPKVHLDAVLELCGARPEGLPDDEPWVAVREQARLLGRDDREPAAE